MLGAALQRPREDVPERNTGAGQSRPRAVDTACELALITDRAGFDALEADWTDLFERAGRDTQLFQSFNWSWHWCNHYLTGPHKGRPAPQLAVVTARRAGRLVMLWPLAVEHVAGLRRLVWMGGPVGQYGDVLIEDGLEAAPLLRQAWDLVIAAVRPDLAWLRKVREDAAIAPLVKDLGLVLTERLEAPYADLAEVGGFEALLKRRSPRARKKRRAMAKRLDALGFRRFEHHLGGAPACEGAKTAVTLKRLQLSSAGVVSPAITDPRLSSFFADAACGGVRPVGVNVVSLASQSDVGAVDIYVGCKGRAALHINAYRPDYEKASIGTHLLDCAIAQACRDGYRTFDFLAPAEPYKLRWADGVVGVNDWALPLSLRGRLFVRLYLPLVRPALKAVLGALPLRLRRAIAARAAR